MAKEKKERPAHICVMGSHTYAEGAILNACEYCNHAIYHIDAPGAKDRERLDLLQDTLDYIIEHIERYGYAPSRRDILEACRYSSTSVVNIYLQELARMDLIELGEGARAINVVGYEWRKIIEDEPIILTEGPPPIVWADHGRDCLCIDCLTGSSLGELPERRGASGEDV